LSFPTAWLLGTVNTGKRPAFWVQAFESPEEFRGVDLELFICNCLIMEGFRVDDCLKIAAWIQEKVDSFIDSQAQGIIYK
jgi:hypothetical protein